MSTAIVSAVVNNSTGHIRVSEATRRRVLAAVDELGYVPNVAARRLAGGRTRLIGAFTYQRMFPMGSADFYFEFLVGIEEAAEEAAYNLLLFTGARDSEGNRTVFEGSSNTLELADGSILVGGPVHPKELSRLHRDGYPLVVIGRRDAIDAGICWVAADYRRGTFEVVRHLAALGHRRIGYVRGVQVHETVNDRRDGFAEVAGDLGWIGHRLPTIVLDPAGTGDVASASALITIARRRRLSALVVESNYVADQVRAAAPTAGVSVPDDLSIIALGDQSGRLPGQEVAPGLAQLVPPSREIGRRAVAMLVELLDGTAPHDRHVLLPCTINSGTTVGVPPDRR